ncbi:MAG TPA: hypothetical protein VIW95_09615 [Candidatus Binatus sp.]|uniref:hypothetical protein n=1 Tax=Candidatus Binatus sp. TaxID=2811406 RepID=UPI002F4036C8
MHEIKSFRIFQTAKVIAVLYLIFGFVEGAILTIVFAHRPHPHPLLGILLSLIGLPILFGVVGFIFLAIGCWLYNIVAARIGGIAFELTSHSEN